MNIYVLLYGDRTCAVYDEPDFPTQEDILEHSGMLHGPTPGWAIDIMSAAYEAALPRLTTVEKLSHIWAPSVKKDEHEP
jgi:hypothetical protein